MSLWKKFTKNNETYQEKRRKTIAAQCTILTERLADIRANFDAVTDPSAIDALIFEENAVLCRLEQLYREARAEGIKVELHERIK